MTHKGYHCLLVGLHALETFPLCGFGYLCLLEGACTMHGYRFPLNRLIPISVPANGSALAMEASAALPWQSSSARVTDAPEAFREAVDTLKANTSTPYQCIFVLIENKVCRAQDFETFFEGIWSGLWGPKVTFNFAFGGWNAQGNGCR